MVKPALPGSCGDYCGACAEYTGLIADTARQLGELVNTYAYEFRSEGVFDFSELTKALQWLTENAGCPVCRRGGGPPSCQVKTCCAEKRLLICFECDEFMCSKPEEVAYSDTAERCARFRELCPQAWLREQAIKAHKGYEIHLRRIPTLTRRVPEGESES